jgi:hypothetical protein
MEGTLLVSSCFSPNTFFAGRVEIVELSSDSLAVEGGCAAIGRVVASTLYGGDTPVSFSSEVTVNGKPMLLSGQGPFDENLGSRRLDLELRSGGYRIRIVAEPNEYRVTGSKWPFCADWGFV